MLTCVQETASEHTPILSQLFRFYNTNASSIRAIMVANCLTSEPPEVPPKTDEVSQSQLIPLERGNPLSHRDINRRSASFRCNMHVPPSDQQRYQFVIFLCCNKLFTPQKEQTLWYQGFISPAIIMTFGALNFKHKSQNLTCLIQ